ncbi:FecR family protein [Larkinella sp. GY13]|uniref:FecR family protein n=1 Tax=Larkinella sp. GY13 TaxID=3453720 RepID=UPI003EEE5463
MSVNKNLLWRYFSGQVTVPERQRIAEWLRDEASRELYFQVLEEWEQEHLQFETDADAALQRYLFPTAKTARESTPDVAQRQTPFTLFFQNRQRWVAAAVLVLISASLYVLRDSILYKTYTTGYGQVRPITLDDGSRVTLNANSTLAIPRWHSDNREVLLKGEAEFSVVHTRDHRRFLVKTADQLEVEVLGTEFVVYSRSRGSKVALTKGKVRLSSLKDKRFPPLTISPGDVVTVDTKGAFNLQTRQELTKYTAWKDHLFVFEHTPLREITSRIEETFGVSIRIKGADLAQRELTGAFEAETADELLEALTKVMNLQQVRQDDHILLLPPRSFEPIQ